MIGPPSASHPVTAHFYRAVVSHADVWRQRMDATTNWAARALALYLTAPVVAAATVVVPLFLPF